MKFRVAAITFVVIGLAIIAYFIRRGPVLVAQPRALTWVRMIPDAGEITVRETRFGIEFVELRDADEPVLSVGALHRGDEWIVFSELNYFEQFVEFDGGVYVVAEWATEGGGPALELLATFDRGEHFTHLATLPKPVYYATFRELTVTGDTLSLRVEVDPDEGLAGLPDEWVFPPWRVQPLTRFRPGTGPEVRIVSKNGGRTWVMER